MEEKFKQAEDRLEVLSKIKELERTGVFDKDVENDPPTIELFPDQIDYKRKKLKNKILRYFTFKGAEKMLNNLIENNILRINGIEGIENLQSIKTGAILTCNHFNAFDSFIMEIVFRKAQFKHKRMYRVIKEGNYTNSPKGYEMIMRHCDTLPLSSNKDTMKKFMRATNELIQEGNLVLIYPEESMWWNYRKPKPLKPGAFRFAIKNNVPVVPIFITMEDSTDIGPDGFPIQVYTIHIEKPIYPDATKDLHTNIEEMKDKNFNIWKDIYEKVYNKPLQYETEVIDENTDPIVKKYAKNKI